MKGVIAAGGYATRFLPVSKAVPKEMLPILGKPMIHHQVEVLLDSGITEIIIVVRKGVDIIHNYWQRDREIEEHIGPALAFHYFGGLERIRHSVQIAYTHELETWPYGDAEAVLAAKPFLSPDEPFYCMWVDDVILGETPVPMQLMEAYGGVSVVAVQQVPIDRSRYYGSVKAQDGLVTEMSGKGTGALAHIGHFIFTPEIFDVIDISTPVDGELWIGDALQTLIAQERLYCCEIEGEWLDVGDLQRYFRANWLMSQEES